VQNLIHAFKYKDRHDARRLFGRWLVGAGADLLADAELIIPVPLHRWRLVSRKFNQAAVLAHEVSRRSGVRCEPLVLKRRKRTRSQVGLSQSERRRNLVGAFEVRDADRGKLDGRRVILLDDVITTGSTVGACARVLRRAGAARIDVLAIAMVTDDGVFAKPRPCHYIPTQGVFATAGAYMPKVTIYTTPICPYCQMAKQLLARKGVAYDEINVMGHPGLREEMRNKSGGRTTVPQIWIGTTHVGGCDDLYELDRLGRLDDLLAA
jgi:GrxC family glutaredoxin